MKRVKRGIWILTVLFIGGTLLLSQPACRREKDPIDKNRPPETFLSVAPPETLGSTYRYHMYWYGEDKDGVIEQYIFNITDSVRTLRPEENRQQEILDWNPANRKADYISGRFTSRTDTVITFDAYDAENELLRNRQAFHIAAVDDGGLIDETPARIQFFSTAEERPQVKYWLKVGDNEYNRYDPFTLDTISMFIPLDIKFLGQTVNGSITGYRWWYRGNTYPRDEDGDVIWRIPETPFDTVYVNDIGEANPLPSGDFFFRGIARDEASALSGNRDRDLCHLVINHDPDTRILYGDNFYSVEGQQFPDCTYVDFSDDMPDTIPFGSWLRISYTGWDDEEDILEFPPPNEKPLRFKYRLITTGVSNEGNESVWQTAYFPAFDPEDTNPGKIDSVTMTISSKKYEFRVRSYDEQNRYDHTPAKVTFYGNFQPTVDAVELGRLYIEFIGQFEPFSGDTIFLADPMDPDNWYAANAFAWNVEDTIFPREVVSAGQVIGLDYTFYIRGEGHDDPRDTAVGPGRAVWYWEYYVDGVDRNYNFGGENEIFYANELNPSINPDNFVRKLSVRVPVNRDTGLPDSTFVEDLKGYFAWQDIQLIGYDMPRGKEYIQKIRAESPTFEKPEDGGPPWILIEKGDMYQSTESVGNYARSDTLTGNIYIKPLW